MIVITGTTQDVQADLNIEDGAAARELNKGLTEAQANFLGKVCKVPPVDGESVLTGDGFGCTPLVTRSAIRGSTAIFASRLGRITC